jgi:hypothetical protein
MVAAPDQTYYILPRRLLIVTPSTTCAFVLITMIFQACFAKENKRMGIGLANLREKSGKMVMEGRFRHQVSDFSPQICLNEAAAIFAPKSPVNFYYCANDPGTGIDIFSAEIQNYPIQRGVTAFYEFQGLGRATFRMQGVVMVLTIANTGSQVIQVSAGDPYPVYQGSWVDYWFSFQFPSYVPSGQYNVNILFIDIYGNVRECIFFPTRL